MANRLIKQAMAKEPEKSEPSLLPGADNANVVTVAQVKGSMPGADASEHRREPARNAIAGLVRLLAREAARETMI